MVVARKVGKVCFPFEVRSSSTRLPVGRKRFEIDFGFNCISSGASGTGGGSGGGGGVCVCVCARARKRIKRSVLCHPSSSHHGVA